MRLITKADRQSLRQTWIKGSVTEKYLDIEILCTKRPDSKVILTIWRGTAGKPHINYLLSNMENAMHYISQEKKYADSRKKWNDENKVKGRTLTQAAKAALNIRNILKREYPGVKFSVKSSNYANGNSVDISWQDGPTRDEIDSFARQFEYGTFDGMTDCYNVDNAKDMPQAKYVHCHRELSAETRTKIRSELAAKMGIADDDNTIIPQEYMVNVRGYNGYAQLSNLVHQIHQDFNFCKGFSGVRNKIGEHGPISNMFELY